ncbi:plasmid pRiA4b ORF-3 family protein (plasmid) [Rhizobium sp. CB3171]|uniref:plasmid pRiA4b ORF-3 family protein n=1 Tax=Rhizobium sp. CB3171 TaxID=3039157 RepID=UPI0024B20B08|nr:plasmid pRiA4b ORF-3 family protein [Rhizobium sp. CB3171]WFU07277.1 plasmid pRiA4b ORF-3 family protein [Rhizobium sp. CB3171]
MQFRVWLKGLSPMVWRRVQVPSMMTLREFHGVLQVAMGWDSIHLYQFIVHTVRYGSWELTAESADIVLDDLKLRKASRFLYEYDLNIPWEHEVRLEDRLAYAPRTRYPCCIGGDGNCPPEDSGGPQVWMERVDEALGYELDNDFSTVLEFIQEISETQSFAALKDPERAEELRETLFRIEDRKALLGRPFARRKVNERLRQDEHLTLMYQQM